MAIPKSVCDNCVNTECLWRAPTGGNDPPVMICPNKIDKPQTNADRIRAMTDEELAEAINSDFNNIPWCDDECPDKCIECIIKWLKEKRDC